MINDKDIKRCKALNKYNLTVADIRKLKVDRSKLTEENGFWRNNVINAWCISGTTAKTEEDDFLGTCDEYWLGVYDEDAEAYADKIRVSFTSYGGMCGYTIKKFFALSDIENQHDLLVQEMFIKEVNRLIENGTFSQA